ncbi:hypothetical protein H1R20_g8121, partial [Candolleomyces eurysporus]
MLGQDVLIASVSLSLIDYPCLLALSMSHHQRNGPDREWKIYCFDDTNRTETEILRTIAFELEKQYCKGQTLHGIIYVHRISDFYVGGLAKTNLGIFRKLCGDSSLQNVVIMTNMWSRLHSESEGRRRAVELASTDAFFKPAIVEGAVMMHHMQNTVESARTVIRQILKNHPIALSIYEETGDQHKSINKTGMGMTADEKVAQLELKLKEQFEAAEQARQEQLKQAERILQLQETLEEEKRNQARQYQLLQEQFADAKREREQAIHEAEERSRREIQAAEARWRQEVEAAEQRRAKEKADLEERMKHMTITPNPPNPGAIVSGRSYAMFNQANKSYYVTSHYNQEHLIFECRLDQERARQQWRFYSEGSTGQCMLWRIQSVSSGKYLCAELERIPGHDSQFRICLHIQSEHMEKAISYAGDEFKEGGRVKLYKEFGQNDELWTMEGCD